MNLFIQLTLLICSLGNQNANYEIQIIDIDTTMYSGFIINDIDTEQTFFVRDFDFKNNIKKVIKNKGLIFLNDIEYGGLCKYLNVTYESCSVKEKDMLSNNKIRSYKNYKILKVENQKFVVSLVKSNLLKPYKSQLTCLDFSKVLRVYCNT